MKTCNEDNNARGETMTEHLGVNLNRWRKQKKQKQGIAVEYNAVLIYLAACYKISLSNMWFKGHYTVALYCQTQVIHSIVTF